MSTLLSDEEFEQEREKRDEPWLPATEFAEEGGGDDPNAPLCAEEEDE